MARVVEFVPYGRQRPVYRTQSIPGLLMVCRQNEPGHQQLWFSPDTWNIPLPASGGFTVQKDANVLLAYWHYNGVIMGA